MPPNEEASEEKITCPICGFQSPAGSERCDNCYHALRPPQDAQKQEAEPEAESKEELMSVHGIGEAKAVALQEAGYKTIKDLQQAKAEDLSSVRGIGEKLASKIIKEAQSMAGAENTGLADWLSGEDNGLSNWLSGDQKAEQQQEGAIANAEPVPNDSLARWLSGKEDDLDAWLQETSGFSRAQESVPSHEFLEKEAELVQLKETFRQKLKEFESGGFDPQTTVEELAKTRADLEAERNTRLQLEEELENVKRGSIAVIKFIRNQQGGADPGNLADKLTSEMALRENLELKIMELESVVAAVREKAEKAVSEMPADAQELKRQEIALAEKQAQMEALDKQLRSKEEALKDGLIRYGKESASQSDAQDEVIAAKEEIAEKELSHVNQVHELESKLAQAELALKQKDELVRASASAGPGKAISPEVLAKLEEAQRYERTLVLREQEVQHLKEELRIRDDETRKLKEPLAYKEQEMLRREEDLTYREKLLQEELRRVAQDKAELTNVDELTLKKRLEDLQSQVTAREEEIRNRERYLASKEEDLRLREQGVIGDEIEKREGERQLEIKQEKVKTGTARLDDLLLGGMPFGSNVMIYGPPFAGKEVLVNGFIAEGLKKGVPALWVITEKSPKEIRDEMVFVLPGYEEYEKRGLVKYVDSYSRSMGDESKDPYTDYVESPTDYESIQKAIERACKEFLKNHDYYRVAFRSISTMIAYLDPNTAFRFLSPIVGRRKRDKAVAMYTIEKGVHGEQEIQMIGSLMDGMIEFKLENLNTFLSIKGICDVQSRAFIRYSSTKAGVSIGSFSLDHIR